MIRSPEPSSLLRRSLQANAWFSGVSGLLFLLATQPIATFLGLENLWMIRVLGPGLLFYALWLGFISRRSTLDFREVWSAIALDGSWVISSAILLVGELLPLTRSGMWAIGIVADMVACLAVLQMYALFKFRSALSLGPSTTTAHHCQ
jgi:hypothetical protein